MFTPRGWAACGLALLALGCAPHGYNDYYGDYRDGYYDDYYGGYPHAGNTYLSYYGGYPYYYRPWYDYPPWYWYDRDHDDDDDDHYHGPPRPDDPDRADYLMRHRTDPADVRPQDITRYRDQIRDLPIDTPRPDRSPVSVRRPPSTSGFQGGAPAGGGGGARISRDSPRPSPGSRSRGER